MGVQIPAPLDARWCSEEHVSHVFAFDVRFGAKPLTNMYRTLGQVVAGPLVGCNPISTRRFWPRASVQVGGSSRSAKMTGRAATKLSSLWCGRIVVEQQIHKKSLL